MNADDKNLRRKTQPTLIRTSPFAMSNIRPIYGETTMVMANLHPYGKKSQSTTKPTQQPECDHKPPRWMTVKGLAKKYSEIITEPALRNLIWHAEAYAKYPKSGLTSNRFLPVIVRPPYQRKVLLDWVEFEKWLTASRSSQAN